MRNEACGKIRIMKHRNWAGRTGGRWVEGVEEKAGEGATFCALSIVGSLTIAWATNER